MEDKENFVEICRNASILDVTAVMEALENGADVIYVSNHGAR